MRPAPDNWPGGWAAWAAQEPRNAHSHLLSMLLGNTLTVPVTAGKLALGTWQVRGGAGRAGAGRKWIGVSGWAGKVGNRWGVMDLSVGRRTLV
jgi:hypothetical protein